MSAAAFDVGALFPAPVEWVWGLICIQSYSCLLFVLAQGVERVIVFISQKCLSRRLSADVAWRRAENAEWKSIVQDWSSGPITAEGPAAEAKAEPREALLMMTECSHIFSLLWQLVPGSKLVSAGADTVGTPGPQ